MSKRSAIIIIIIVTLVIVAGLLIFYLLYGGGAPAGGGLGFPSTPSGTQPAVVRPPSTTGTITGGGGGAPGAFVPILKQLSTAPVGGSVIVGGGESVRFVDRGTGNIWGIGFDGSALTRLTNTTVPKVYESLFGSDGSALVLRYLRDQFESIASYYAEIKPGASGQAGSLVGSFLPENSRQMVSSPDSKSIFYILRTGDGSVGVTANLNGSNRVQIFGSPLQELIPAWPTPSVIALTSKASSFGNGVLLFLNAKTGGTKKILGDIAGLTTLISPDGGMVLYSVSGKDGGFSTKLYNLRDGNTSDMPVNTIPEKCVWSKVDLATFYCAVPETIPAGFYPDVWYQGLASFTDDIWQINAVTGNGKDLLALRDYAHKDIDATNLALNKKENGLIFVNKNDLILWSLQFKP